MNPDPAMGPRLAVSLTLNSGTRGSSGYMMNQVDF